MRSGRKTGLMVYCLQMAATVCFFTSVIGVMLNYINMKNVRGTWVESHFRWQIRTFWWGFVFGPLIAVLIFLNIPAFYLFGDLFYFSKIFLPLLVMMMDMIWIMYRVIRGIVNLDDKEKMNSEKDLYLEAAKGYEQEGDWDNAAHCYKKAGEEKKSREAYLKAAQQYEEKKDIIGAIRCYEESGNEKKFKALCLKKAQELEEKENWHGAMFFYQEAGDEKKFKEMKVKI